MVIFAAVPPVGRALPPVEPRGISSSRRAAKRSKNQLGLPARLHTRVSATCPFMSIHVRQVFPYPTNVHGFSLPPASLR
ncbi:unnamed protein product, partial [Nesidiocoris tenuis]